MAILLSNIVSATEAPQNEVVLAALEVDYMTEANGKFFVVSNVSDARMQRKPKERLRFKLIFGRTQ